MPLFGSDYEYGAFGGNFGDTPGAQTGGAPVPFTPTPAPQTTPNVPAPAQNQPYTGPGPNDDAGGQGYDPATMGGTFADWQAARRAYRSTFNPNDPNGWRARRNEQEDLQMAAALQQNPNMSEAQLGQLLNSMGIYNIKDQRASRYKSIMQAFNGHLLYGTNAALDGQGNYADIGTSDTNVNGVFQPLGNNPNLQGQAQNSFLQQLEGNLGIGASQRWQRNGQTGMQRDPQTGYYFNVSPNGERTYYNEQMYRVDPRTGQILGHYQFPGLNLGSLMSGRP